LNVEAQLEVARLLDSCEGMLLSTLQTRELDIIWNNAFRYILTVVGVNQ